jgi:hypothetical protein
MNTKTSTFQELSQQVMREIANHLSANKLSLAESLALLKMLSLADNIDELQRLIVLLSDRFPLLRIFREKDTQSDKIQDEQEVQRLVAKILKSDPLLAAEVSKAIMKKDYSLSDLKSQYPQLQKYI